jgi:hypothetical protein
MKAGNTARVGLDGLRDFELSDRGTAMLDQAIGHCTGPARWQSRKIAEAREILALAEMAPPGRMSVEYLDVASEIRAACRMQVPAPWRREDGEVCISNSATLGMVYPERAVTQQIPGFGFIELMLPRPVFHPSIAAQAGIPQLICLGQLPAGMRCTDLLLLAYGALSMQTVQFDERDRLGVMNIEAAKYWQQRSREVPLSRTAFLEVDAG